MFLLNFLEDPLTHEFKVFFFYANDGTTKSSWENAFKSRFTLMSDSFQNHGFNIITHSPSVFR